MHERTRAKTFQNRLYRPTITSHDRRTLGSSKSTSYLHVCKRGGMRGKFV